MSALEAHYRRLLQLYPAAYRQQRGDEILATLVESADSERQRPTFGDTVDLVGHALRLRLAIGEQQPIGRLLVALGPSQLVLASLMSIIAIVWGEWSPFSPWPWVPPGHLGPFFTVGPVAYLAWILSGLSLLVHRPRLTRALATFSIVLTVALVPIGHLFGLGRPAMSYLVFLVLLGLPYAAVPNQGSVWSARRASQKLLLAIPFVVATVFALATARSGTLGLNPGEFFYRQALADIDLWIPWVVGVLIIVAVASMALGRKFLGAAVALMGLPWMALWWANHFGNYVSPRGAMLGFMMIAVLVFILAKYATTVRSNVLEEAGSN